MKSPSRKGSAFERELCVQFSLWWSGGKDTDLCWRTSGSGGRATRRTKSSQRTSGHYGDMGATDDRMRPFFSLVTVEVKRGYPSVTPSDLIDRDDAGPRTLTAFIKQAQESARQAKTPYWMLIHKRDRKEALVYVPWDLDLCVLIEPLMFLNDDCLLICHKNKSILCVRLKDFFRRVKKADFLTVNP